MRHVIQASHLVTSSGVCEAFHKLDTCSDSNIAFCEAQTAAVYNKLLNSLHCQKSSLILISAEDVRTFSRFDKFTMTRFSLVLLTSVSDAAAYGCE